MNDLIIPVITAILFIIYIKNILIRRDNYVSGRGFFYDTSDKVVMALATIFMLMCIVDSIRYL